MTELASAQSAATISLATAAGEPRKFQRFRRSDPGLRLSADQQRRQAAAMKGGWSALGSRQAMMAFFNTYSDTLGGRPLDLAVDSDGGLAMVMDALKTSTST